MTWMSCRSVCTPGERGQSLIGLTMTLALVGTISSLIVPDLAGTAAGAKIRSAAFGFMQAVNLARSTAIRQGRPVVICPSANGNDCLETGWWHRGWILFDDRDGDREHDGDEAVLQSAGAQPGVTLISGRSRRRLTLQPTGFSPGSNGTYTVCATGKGRPKAIIVANHGRARIADTRPDGGALRCDRV